MKTLKILILALFVFACHKKHDDPAPAKTITIYITKNAYYPGGTPYVGATVTVRTLPAWTDLLNPDKNTDVDGRVVYTGPVDGNSYGYKFYYESRSLSGPAINIPLGIDNTLLMDSFYVHTIYQ